MTSSQVCTDKCEDIRADMSVDMRIDMQMDMQKNWAWTMTSCRVCTNRCEDMRTDMCVDMNMDMRIDMLIGPHTCMLTVVRQGIFQSSRPSPICTHTDTSLSDCRTFAHACPYTCLYACLRTCLYTCLATAIHGEHGALLGSTRSRLKLEAEQVASCYP